MKNDVPLSFRAFAIRDLRVWWERSTEERTTRATYMMTKSRTVIAYFLSMPIANNDLYVKDKAF